MGGLIVNFLQKFVRRSISIICSLSSALIFFCCSKGNSSSSSSSVNVSPVSGSVGTLLSITGTEIDLAGIGSVTLSGVTALPVSLSSFSSAFLVMPGSSSGPVYISTKYGDVVEATSHFNVVAVTPPMNQQTKLKGAGFTGTTIYQGTSASLSADGNTAIVGGNGDSANTGAAWIFTRSGGNWTQQAKLIASDAIGAASFGGSIDISADGNTAIVGGSGDNSNAGAAWVFTRSNGTWTQQAKLIGVGSIGVAGQGAAVAVSADGNTVAVGGSTYNSNVGATWIFVRKGGSWTQQTRLVGLGAIGAANQGDCLSLSSDGNTVVIGGYGDNSDAGAAWIFTRSNSIWTQQAKISGNSIGTAFQCALDINADGSTVIIGGFGDNSYTGAAWIFSRSSGGWTQQAKLVGSGAVGSAWQGFLVSLTADGNTALVGGPNDSSNVGAAWIFQNVSGTWIQRNEISPTNGVGSTINFGYAGALSSDGSTLLIGGNHDDSNVGASWVFSP